MDRGEIKDCCDYFEVNDYSQKLEDFEPYENPESWDPSVDGLRICQHKENQ